MFFEKKNVVGFFGNTNQVLLLGDSSEKKV